jgi:hypothetical protein
MTTSRDLMLDVAAPRHTASSRRALLQRVLVPPSLNLVVRVDYTEPVTIVHNTVDRSYYQSL